MARKKIKHAADVRPALARGTLSEDERGRILKLGARALPELRDAALDPEGVHWGDPSTELALALVEAIGMPADWLPQAMTLLEELPEDAGSLPTLGRAAGSAGLVAWRAALDRAQEPCSPMMAQRLGWVLAGGEGEEVREGLRALTRIAPQGMAWVLAWRADPLLLPALDHALAHVAVPLDATVEYIDALHRLVTQAQHLGADHVRVIMLLEAVVERLRGHADHARARLRALQGALRD